MSQIVWPSCVRNYFIMVAATYSSLHDCPIWLYSRISRTRFTVNLQSTILPEYQNPLFKTFGQAEPTIELCWKCWFIWCIWLYVLVISRTRFRVNPNSLAAWMLKNSLLEIPKRAFNHLTKLAKWLSCVVSTYLCGALDCMFLPCHVRFSEWTQFQHFTFTATFTSEHQGIGVGILLKK